MPNPIQRLLLPVIVAGAVLSHAASWAAKDFREINLSFTIEAIEFGGGSLRKLTISCREVNFTGKTLDCPSANVSFNSDRIGEIKAASRFQWDVHRNTYQLDTSLFAFANGKARISLLQKVNSADAPNRQVEDREDHDLNRMSIIFKHVDAPTLWDMGLSSASAALAGYDMESGEISGVIDCSGGANCHYRLNLSNLNFSGVNAAEDADISIDVKFNAQEQQLIGSLRLDAGTMYIEPGFSIGENKPGFLITAVTDPIEFEAELKFATAVQPFSIQAAAISHPHVVDMKFAGDLSFGEPISWDALALDIHSPNLEEMYATYIQPVIFGSTVDSLDLSGKMEVVLRGATDEITDLEIRLDDAYFDDAYDRFAMYQVNGNFALTSSAETLTSSVVWAGAAIYGISFGSGKIDWGSKERDVWIADWDDVDVFDGALSINELSVTKFGTRDAEVELSGALSPVSMEQVMASFGLPSLAGKVAAVIPKLSFKRNKLQLDGAIEVNMFNGKLQVEHLEIADLFSSVPKLQADIVASGLDLGTLTSRFSFGNISGTLDGYIKSVELEAWQPIAFDAFFATREDDHVRHRISRQAVDNLGRIGAQTSVLSSGWLKLIPSYSYGQLGLGCRLHRGHCLMSGVEDAGANGFFVLTRGGLLPPWINILGQGRLISWQTLLDGIKQISTGEVAVELGGQVPKDQLPIDERPE